MVSLFNTYIVLEVARIMNVEIPTFVDIREIGTEPRDGFQDSRAGDLISNNPNGSSHSYIPVWPI